MIRATIIIAAVLSAASVCPAYPYTAPFPGDFTDTSEKTEVPCNKAMTGKTMVALAFGQSNSANYGQTLMATKRNAYNFYDSKCYKAADPMLGATRNGGSVWTRLGDMLIESGTYDNVIFVTIGVGGSEVKRWAPDGDLNGRIADVARQLEQKKLKLTHLLWHQGESDLHIKTPKDEYKRMFMAMFAGIRKLGIDAPIYVAVATHCGGGGFGGGIQSAQRELVNPALKIYPGADSDKLAGIEDRYDDCHFSASGLKKHAEMWFNAIKLSGK
jgi:hypothetical protein